MLGTLTKRIARRFYEDQMTHHAAAMTYYVLMSLFPALLIAVSLLGLVGEYPRTYNAIVNSLRDVVPDATLRVVDSSVRGALQHRGAAASALAIAVVVALYGTTGALAAARRALNVVYGAPDRRGIVHRKLIEIASSFVLMAAVLIACTLVFVGGGVAEQAFDWLGLKESTASKVWGVARWPAALMVAIFVFGYVYHTAPDEHPRSFRWISPGAVIGVAVWLVASALFSLYMGNFSRVSTVYGAFTGPIVLVAWIWLSNVALLFGALVDAQLEVLRSERADSAKSQPGTETVRPLTG
jgi:membrane protein